MKINWDYSSYQKITMRLSWDYLRLTIDYNKNGIWIPCWAYIEITQNNTEITLRLPQDSPEITPRLPRYYQKITDRILWDYQK